MIVQVGFQHVNMNGHVFKADGCFFLIQELLPLMPYSSPFKINAFMRGIKEGGKNLGHCLLMTCFSEFCKKNLVLGVVLQIVPS